MSLFQRLFPNRNVNLIILFCFLDGACFSVWNAQLLSLYIHKFGGDTVVGWCTAIRGISQMLGAIISGYIITDKYMCIEIIRTGAFCGILSVFSTIVAINLYVLPAIFITQSLWGIYIGLISTSIETLFADCVLSGQRSFIYNFKWIIQTICYCIGYLVSLMMLFIMGNKWSISNIQFVMNIGLITHPIAHVVLLLLRYEYVLNQNEAIFDIINIKEKNKQKEQKEQKLLLLYNNQINNTKLLETTEDILHHHHNNNDNDDIITTSEYILNNNNNNEEEEEEEDGDNNTDLTNICGISFSFFHPKILVPYLLCFTEIWMSLGAGMMVQYLSLFLVNNFNILPLWLMISYILISCGSVCCSIFIRYISENYIGRLPSIIFIRFIGTTCTLCLAYMHNNNNNPHMHNNNNNPHMHNNNNNPHMHNNNNNLIIVLIFFILRGSLMNSTLGLTRSVLMDCVLKSNRSKWSAFENVTFCIWAFSALIGGYISEKKGYQFIFLITAIFHYIGTFLLIPAALSFYKIEKKLKCLKQREKEQENEVVF